MKLEKQLTKMGAKLSVNQSSQRVEITLKENLGTEENVTNSKKRPCTDREPVPKLKKRKYESEDEYKATDYGESKFNADTYYDSDDADSPKISERSIKEKRAVLDFLNAALPQELLLINHCTQAKVDLITKHRPFSCWSDLVQKFQNYTQLGLRILKSTEDLMDSRNHISALMTRCLKISEKIDKAIFKGKSAIKEQPKMLSHQMKLAPYQMVSLNWLGVMHLKQVSAILADEMGLGKTIQIIAFLTYLKENNLIEKDDGPHLIVVPCSTLDNWINEFELWSPKLKIFKYYGSQEERKKIRKNWRANGFDDIDIILTTYTAVQSTPEERKFFGETAVNYAVFDEAHMLKNMNTNRYQNLDRIYSKSRILLTGTPLQNNLLELMSLLAFVMPTLFDEKIDHIKNFFSNTSKIPLTKTSNKSLFEDEQIEKAKKIMKPFMMRRLKTDVLKDLPVKTEEVIKCNLLKDQTGIYKNLIKNYKKEVSQNESFDSMTIMMQLRKASNHPLLVLNYYTYKDLKVISEKLAAEASFKQNNADDICEDLLWKSDYHINKLSKTYKSLARFSLPLDLIPKSGKLKIVDKLLPALNKEGHRVLIFSQFLMVLDILEEFLTIRNFKYLRIDGSTKVEERQQLIDQFNKSPEILVFLLSTKAGGLGINLTAADTVIIHDIDFNPYNDKQAEDRCHRVGQTKPVRVIRLVSKDTIEENMYEICQKKLKLEEKMTNNEKTGSEKESVAKILKMALSEDKNIGLPLTKVFTNSPTTNKSNNLTAILDEKISPSLESDKNSINLCSNENSNNNLSLVADEKESDCLPSNCKINACGRIMFLTKDDETEEVNVV